MNAKNDNRPVFEVMRGDKVMAWTAARVCIPERKLRDELRKAGYRLFLNGKLWKEGKA